MLKQESTDDYKPSRLILFDLEPAEEMSNLTMTCPLSKLVSLLEKLRFFPVVSCFANHKHYLNLFSLHNPSPTVYPPCIFSTQTFNRNPNQVSWKKICSLLQWVQQMVYLKVRKEVQSVFCVRPVPMKKRCGFWRIECFSGISARF